jgi:hypothetical protein
MPQTLSLKDGGAGFPFKVAILMSAAFVFKSYSAMQ